MKQVGPQEKMTGPLQCRGRFAIGTFYALLAQTPGFFQLPANGMKDPGSAQQGEQVGLVHGPPREQQPALVRFSDFRDAVALRAHERWAERYQQFLFLQVAFRVFRELAAKP